MRSEHKQKERRKDKVKTVYYVLFDDESMSKTTNRDTKNQK